MSNIEKMNDKEKQIKNYKKYFNIEARNLDGQVDKK